MNQTIIAQTSETKYLGIVLDKKLTLEPHIKHTNKKIAAVTKQLHWLIKGNLGLKLKNKTALYTTMIKPLWTYGITL